MYYYHCEGQLVIVAPRTVIEFHSQTRGHSVNEIEVCRDRGSVVNGTIR